MGKSVVNTIYGVSALALSLASVAPVQAQTIQTARNSSAAPTQSSDATPSISAPVASSAETLAPVVVTGSRIPRTGLTSTSPVDSTSREQIKLDNALTFQDFEGEMPQLAGGVRDTAEGSDSFGANVIDLRNFGQSRTLVLIDGTRAEPFSFRNSVDINQIPASLIQQVDVLTGGAAAVYGADAVAGVVNFKLNTKFNGVEATATDRTAQAGGSEYGASLLLGGDINDRGHIVFAFDYTNRQQQLAGSRSWAATPNQTVAPAGGNFIDVASGRTFSITSAGAFTNTTQTSNYTSLYPLIEPLQRYNADTFFNYKLLDNVELYGRGMYSDVQTQESGTPGPGPVAINQTVGINQNNAFLTPPIANELTFVNGVAQVHVNKTLPELGLIDFHTERQTEQFQLGLRGNLTKAIKWDAYTQYGRSTESSPITGDGLVTNSSGQNNFAAIANTVNIFSPNASGLGALGSTLVGNDRTRDQAVTAATISGDSSDLYSLPAGPVGFALGYEYRRETASIQQDSALVDGDTYLEGSLAAYGGAVTTNDMYGEILIPVIKNLPFIKSFDIEGAYRNSKYSLFGSHNTSKYGFTWAIDDNLRLRGTVERVIRAPNFGEFAAPESSLPYYDLVTVARLTPRYGGDPCVLGTGNAAQCARFGAPAVGSVNSLSASYLEGNYYYGGNADIQPEKGLTKTFGLVVTPQFARRFTATIDYYELSLGDAVGVVQPIVALNSCYVLNPVANNPLCALVPRDPKTGQLDNTYVNNQNLGRLDQQGVDVSLNYTVPTPAWMPGRSLAFSYQGTYVTYYTIQSNPAVSAINCAGTFGATCSSDATTLVQPSYRHNVTAAWRVGPGQAQLDWQEIGAVRDSTPGKNDKIPAQNYLNLNTSWQLKPWLTLNAGIRNLFDKDPPYVPTSTTFNTFPDTYDLEGRTFAVSLTARH